MKKEVVKYIEKYWTYYIDGNYVYKVIPAIYLEKITKAGISRKNPLAKYYADLEKFWLILEKLYRKGFPLPKDSAFQFIALRKEMSGITLTSNLEEAKWLCSTNLGLNLIKELTDLAMKQLLADEELKLIKKIHKWSGKITYSVIIKVKLSALKSSEVTMDDVKEKAPLGPLNYFKNQLKKRVGKSSLTIADVEGVLEKYHPYLVCKKPFTIKAEKLKKEDIILL